MYLRKYVNPMNQEQYVKFQFLKLVWNPYSILNNLILSLFMIYIELWLPNI